MLLIHLTVSRYYPNPAAGSTANTGMLIARIVVFE